jgi:hypothetical protein
MRIRDPQWKKFGIRDPRWKKFGIRDKHPGCATLISSNTVGSPSPRVRVRAMPHHLQEPGLPQGALPEARRQAFRLRPLRQGVPQPQEPPHAQEGPPPARGEVSILILLCLRKEQIFHFSVSFLCLSIPQCCGLGSGGSVINWPPGIGILNSVITESGNLRTSKQK